MRNPEVHVAYMDLILSNDAFQPFEKDTVEPDQGFIFEPDGRAKSHPMTTPPEVVARLLELALEHPAYGCNRLEAMLALEGRRL